jgi:hypothetical protein
VRVAAGEYWCASWARNGEGYRIDVRAMTCTCPDHAKRGRVCKHLEAACAVAWMRAWSKAQLLTTRELERVIELHADRLDVVAACEYELYRRTHTHSPNPVEELVEV